MILSGNLFLETKFACAVYDFLEEHERYSKVKNLQKIANEYLLVGKKQNTKKLLQEICQEKHQEFFKDIKHYLIR